MPSPCCRKRSHDESWIAATGSAAYAIGTQGWSREQYLLSPGLSLALPADWKIDLEMGLGGSADQRTSTTRMQISKQF